MADGGSPRSACGLRARRARRPRARRVRGPPRRVRRVPRGARGLPRDGGHARDTRPRGRPRPPRCASASSSRLGKSVLARASSSSARDAALRLTAIAAAAAVAAAIGLGVWAASLSSSLDAERSALAEQARAAAILADADSTRVPMGERGELVRSPDGDAVMVVRNLAPAPEGQTYEAWVIDSGGPVTAGLFEGGGQEIVLLEEPVGRRRDGRRHARAGRRIRAADGGHPLRERGSLMGGDARPADRDPGREGIDRTCPRVTLRRGAARASSPRPTASSPWPSSTTATARSRTASPTACCGTPRWPRTRSRKRSSPCGGRRARTSASAASRAPGCSRSCTGAPSTSCAASSAAVCRQLPRSRRRPRRRREDEATLRDRRRAVQAALTQLPADQREALELALLRRPDADGARRAARRAARHHQEPDVRRAYAGSETCSGKQASKPEPEL